MPRAYKGTNKNYYKFYAYREVGGRRFISEGVTQIDANVHCNLLSYRWAEKGKRYYQLWK